VADDDDREALLKLARIEVGRQHGIPERDAHRIVGSTVAELHRDAAAMAKEYGVLDPTERARDELGNFAGGKDMNTLIREASGR
jgi:hypothetical protein